MSTYCHCYHSQFVFISPLVDAFFDFPGYEITIDAEQGIAPPSGKDFDKYVVGMMDS